MKKSPAELVIETFGGLQAVATVCKVHRSTVFRWRDHSPRGHRGSVPQHHFRRLLDVARRRGLTLTESDLIRGR